MIDIEGDSLNIVRSITLGSTPSWKSQMRVKGILEILDGMEFSIKLVFREINKEANFLSNHAIDKRDQAIISECIDNCAGLTDIIANSR